MNEDEKLYIDLFKIGLITQLINQIKDNQDIIFELKMQNDRNLKKLLKLKSDISSEDLTKTLDDLDKHFREIDNLMKKEVQIVYELEKRNDNLLNGIIEIEDKDNVLIKKAFYTDKKLQ